MNTKRIAAAGTLASVLAAAGIIGGIAESSASTTSQSPTTTTTSQSATTTTSGAYTPGTGGRGFGHFGHGGFGARGAIHSVSVQPNQAHTGYVTVTTDNGTLKSVDTTANTVTLVEGIATSPYATPTIAVPTNASVTLDGTTSTLAGLAAGDHITIRSSSDGTSTVFATNASFSPARGPGGWGGGWHHGGGHGTPPSTTTTTTTSST